MDESIDIRKRRAVWRASHRGTKELDILVGRYAEAQLAGMDAERLAHFEGFLAVTDPELQGWLLGAMAGQGGEFAALVADIRAFHGLKT